MPFLHRISETFHFLFLRKGAIASEKIISKSYFYQEESGYGGDFVYDHAEGDKIEWKSSKDLTVRVDSKKQRNKSKDPRDPFRSRVDLGDKIQIPNKLAS